MRNSTWILLYIALLMAVVFFEYKNNNKIRAGISAHKYKIEENKLLDGLVLEYIRPLNVMTVSNEQWGIVPKKVKEENLTKEDNTTDVLTVTLKEKTLCIEKECFKLLGIFTEKNQKMASFYNENSKEKTQAFLVGEMMSSTIKIKTIMKKNVTFKDINSTREWQMKMFDVNSSKYKPKDFE